MGKKINWERKVIILSLFFFLIIFWGCVKKNAVISVSEEDVLREKIMAYWNHKIEQEFDKSYEFEDPFYRKSVSMVNYIKSFRPEIVKWMAVEIDNIKIEDNSAVVNLKLRHKVNLPGIKNIERTSFIEEQWVKLNGIWYHVPQKGEKR